MFSLLAVFGISGVYEYWWKYPRNWVFVQTLYSKKKNFGQILKHKIKPTVTGQTRVPILSRIKNISLIWNYRTIEKLDEELRKSLLFHFKSPVPIQSLRLTLWWKKLGLWWRRRRVEFWRENNLKGLFLKVWDYQNPDEQFVGKVDIRRSHKTWKFRLRDDGKKKSVVTEK